MCDTRFVRNYPAMLIGEWLVVADLHIGVTRELYDAGVSIPSQVRGIVERIKTIKKLTDAKKIILLGDVKHNVPGTSWQELVELPSFFKYLIKGCGFKEVIVVKGNHDGHIERLIPSFLRDKINVRKSFSLKNCFLTHGNMKIKTKKKTIIIGHNQPAVLIRDSLGVIYVEPVWVRGQLKRKSKGLGGNELIIMPAFNELRGHTYVNRDRVIGPIAKMLDKRNSHVYLLDGTDLGEIGDLKE